MCYNNSDAMVDDERLHLVRNSVLGPQQLTNGLAHQLRQASHAPNQVVVSGREDYKGKFEIWG